MSWFFSWNWIVTAYSHSKDVPRILSKISFLSARTPTKKIHSNYNFRWLEKGSGLTVKRRRGDASPISTRPEKLWNQGDKGAIRPGIPGIREIPEILRIREIPGILHGDPGNLGIRTTRFLRTAAGRTRTTPGIYLGKKLVLYNFSVQDSEVPISVGGS